MRTLISVLLTLLFSLSAQIMLGSPLQQNEDQNAAPQQNAQPTSPDEQGTTSRAVQSVTGCVVQGDHGYSLKTEKDTYPIETDKDLSQYVNKKVKVTGILEQGDSTSSSGGTIVRDIRLRMVVTVIGDCNEPSK